MAKPKPEIKKENVSFTLNEIDNAKFKSIIKSRVLNKSKLLEKLVLDWIIEQEKQQ